MVRRRSVDAFARTSSALRAPRRRVLLPAILGAVIVALVPSATATAGTNPSAPISGNNATTAFGNNGNGQLWSAAANPNYYPTPPAGYSASVTIDTYNGSTKVVHNPCTIAAVDRATMVSAGGNLGMALISGGHVCVWGDNYWGGEAQGDSVLSHLAGQNPTGTLGPVPVCLPESWTLVTAPNTGYGYCGDAGKLLTHVTSISAGGAFTLVLLGKGSKAPKDTTVTPHIPASSIPHGSVAAWGANYNGQMGNSWSAGSPTAPYPCANGTYNCSAAPVAVSAGNCTTSSPYLSGVARVSAGSNFALAEIGVTTAGTTTNRVCSWGDNTDGQLGLGGSSNETTSAGDSPNYCPYVGSSGSSYCSWTPQPVLSVCDGDATATGAPGPLTNVYDISAGTGLALALLNDGSVCSWGDNTHGELGINTFVGPDTCTNNNPQTSGPDTYTNCALSAQQVVTGNCPFTSSFTLNNVVQISAGLYDALALLGGGNVCTWGDGTGGGLGSGASYDSADPIPVVAVGGSGYLSAVTCISAGNQHGLAVVKAASGAGTLLTWGADLATGQNGSSGSTSDPIGVPLSSSSSSGDVTRTSSISAGSGAWNLETRGTKGCMLPPPTP